MQESEHEVVLLVEDDASLRRALARLLERDGRKVIEVASGMEALAHLERRDLDVVVTDIQMPDMSGIDVLREVRKRNLDVPVILETGLPSLSTAIAAVEHGALVYLTKPFEPSAFLAAVRRASMLHAIARAKRKVLELNGLNVEEPGDRVGLEQAFARAMESLWIAVQPILDVNTRAPYGYEALVRTEERALPHPGAVLDAAERLDRLRHVGRAVRDRAASVLESAPGEVALFVNLHPSDLLDEHLYDPESALASIARRVVLEITERASLARIKDVRGRVSALRALGFRIAVDDLGAGYAGLSSFADLEPEIVKFDMSLVRGIDASSTRQKLVRSMTAVCHDLGIGVVAEGVETAAERDCLVELKVDYLQGYRFARPARPYPVIEW